MRRARDTSGYTLLELLIVVAVLTVLIAAVLPAMSAAKRSANETAAVAGLRTLSNAQLQYRTRFGSFAEIDDLAGSSLLDSSFDEAEKLGYRFVAAEDPGYTTWAVVAEPIDPGVSGDRFFWVDESGVIRFRDGEPPSNTDAPVD